MAILMPRIRHVKQILPRSPFVRNIANAATVPKGCLAIYVGESQRKRFVVPAVSFLSEPAFQDLLNRSEEELGFDHPDGGLIIPCREDIFTDLMSRLRRKSYRRT